MHYLPLISVVTPFIFALAIILFVRGKEIIFKALAAVSALLTFAITILMLLKRGELEYLGTQTGFLASPLTFTIGADSLSIFMSLIFSFCFLLAIIYSWSYISHSHAKARYYALLLITQGAMQGVVLSMSLAGLFIFFELMAISIYLLVIHEEDETAMFAGAKFLFMTIGAGLAIFFGMAVTYYLGGRLDFIPGGYITASPLARYGLLAFLAGFGVKSGMVPLHIWLPDAHPAAPAPFSALLSGCSIKTGVYGLIRVIHEVYGIETIRALSFDRVLLILAVITIRLGSAMALQQDQLKRRLAYSSVAQIGYVLLGVSLLTEQAMFGALFHIFSHAMMKSTLFLCAGSIITQTGKKYISQMAGIGYRMPVVMLSFSLASMTIVGLPPFIAFISKFNLAMAALETGRVILILVLLTSSMLNALYYFPVVINAFFPRHREGTGRFTLDRVSSGMLWTTVLMASCCVIFAFLEPNWPIMLATRIAAALF
ncbi:MAG: monovalent cation/H+ antiporter subunit D family protein [Dethiobacter sp.]|jgi:multicomponent Na+:H+ antiporter subunit D|nr:monovalent cation/H+ antiporter subunit D family protein [Dethiobacter sp.]